MKKTHKKRQAMELKTMPPKVRKAIEAYWEILKEKYIDEISDVNVDPDILLIEDLKLLTIH